MKKRFKLSRKHSRKMFSKAGSRTHVKNMHSGASRNPMRGGIRL